MDGKNIIIQENELRQYNVVKEQTIYHEDSITDIIKQRKFKELYKFMEEKNLLDRKIFLMEDILWLLSDKQHYQTIINILKQQGHYTPDVWQYAFVHEDLPSVIEWMVSRYRSGD